MIFGSVLTNLGTEDIQIFNMTVSGTRWFPLADCDPQAVDPDDPLPFIGATLQPGEHRATCAVFSPDSMLRRDATLAVETSAGTYYAELIGLPLGAGEDRDNDLDNVADDLEKGPLGDDDGYDGNGDGIADWTQAHVASFPTTEECTEEPAALTRNCYVTIVNRSPTIAALTDVNALSREQVESSSGGGPGVGEYPYGYFSFTLINRAGVSRPFDEDVVLEIYLTSADPDSGDFLIFQDAPEVNGYRKFGPGIRQDGSTLFDGLRWYNFWRNPLERDDPTSPLIELGASCRDDDDPSASCRWLELRLRDGDLGDNDGRWDGMISDPGGPVVLASDDDEDSSSSGGCFIATAAYGSYLAPEVQLLRDFRDGYLLSNMLGRSLVDFYYTASPPIAEFIDAHENAKTLTLALLTPIVYSVKYPGYALFATVLLVLLGWRWRQRRKVRH